jgi:hypothetical protein
MDVAYHAFRMLFQNKPFFAPIDEFPQEILDIGTGTGKCLESRYLIFNLDSR